MTWLRGHFLIASPHLGDPNFYHSVVLMVQHDEQGALGVILNRPTDRTFAQLSELLEEPWEGVDDTVIFIGGPVAGPLIAVHQDPACAESEILEDVYFASTRSSITRLLSESTAPRRFFLGYAGWAGGQLEAELRAGGWLTLPATAEAVFSDPDELWRRTSRQVGLDILSPTIKGRRVPEDPSVN